MNADEATSEVIHVLHQLEVPYMLVGSLSSAYYGVARSTKDADFVIHCQGKPIRDITNCLGVEFQLNPQILFESVTGTTRFVIDVESIPFSIEFFRLSNDPHDQKRFQRRKRVRLTRFGCEVCIPTPEDVIVTKMRWAVSAARGKDSDDVSHVIAVQQDNLDWDYIYNWCDQHGTRERLDEIRASIPPLD